MEASLIWWTIAGVVAALAVIVSAVMWTIWNVGCAMWGLDDDERE